MTKQIPVNPKQTTKSEKLKLADIPINTYKNDLGKECLRWGTDKLREILKHMLIIREFESMLHSFKSEGDYRGIKYDYKGPAHLSIGQEGVSVGMSISLTPQDQIFGSHRSHGEIIA